MESGALLGRNTSAVHQATALSLLSKSSFRAIYYFLLQPIVAHTMPIPRFFHCYLILIFHQLFAMFLQIQDAVG